MLAQRRAFPLQEQARASQQIQQSLASRPEFAVARVLALYSPIHGEVDTTWLRQLAMATGKTVLLPVMTAEALLFRELRSNDDLVPGAFGIMEPTAACPVRQPAEADLLVVPGVAFDLAGRRLGYGKGCYDRALHRLENSGKLVAIAYDFQVLDEIVGESHDVQMDLIITEMRIVTPRFVTIEKGVQQ
jgi:5-formyltetrahydrofolate cyclo-ligase